MPTPLYDEYIKGADNAGIDGDLITNLPTDALGDELGKRILPPNPIANRVPVAQSGGNVQWDTTPSPDFSAIVDKLAPLNPIGTLTDEILAGDADKHHVSDIILPPGGEIKITVQGNPLVHAITSDGNFYEFSPAAGAVVSNNVQMTHLGTFDYVPELITYTNGKFYGASAIEGAVNFFVMDRDTFKSQDLGPIANLTTIDGMSFPYSAESTFSSTELFCLCNPEQQLYGVDLATMEARLLNTRGDNPQHSGIVKGTLTVVDTNVLAIANVTASNRPALVKFVDGGVAEQIGGAFAYGDVQHITSMFLWRLHHSDKENLYFQLTNGHVYQILLDSSQTPTTATVTPRGTGINIPAKQGVHWVDACDAPQIPGKLLTEARSFANLPAVAKDAAVSKNNALHDQTDQYFFGRTDENKLTYGSKSGLELSPMLVEERTFTGGRPVRVNLLNKITDAQWRRDEPANIPLDYHGWDPGDVLQFIISPWYHGPTQLPTHEKNHIYCIDVDTTYAGEIGGSNDIHYYHNVHQLTTDNTVFLADGVGWRWGIQAHIRISINPSRKDNVKVWPHANGTQAITDVARVHRIYRLR